MAGKNRANTLASVLMNNDVLQSAYNDSKYNAAGKATEELEKVSQGIEFHLNQLQILHNINYLTQVYQAS